MEKKGTNVLSNTSDRRTRPFLVVDSDTRNLLYTSMLLQRFEYQTSTAKTAQEALTIVTTTKPSLIITALGLTNMNGLDLIQLLKNDPKTADVPFIALRKQEDPIKEQHCVNAGAVDCLSLPFSIEQLYRAVQAAVEATPRTAIRIRTIHAAKVKNISSEDGDSMHTLDMSERGVFLRTANPAPADTRLSLRINLHGLIIAAEAQVVYTCSSGRSPYREPGMGLEFVQIAPKDQEFIRHFVRQEIMRGINR